MAPVDADYHKILVPLDGSASAESALPVASALAQATKAPLCLARVHEPPTMATVNAFEWNRDVELRELDYLTAVAGRLERKADVRSRTSLLIGHAADVIRRAAHRDGKTLIVMASHGRTGLSRRSLGSVADAVVQDAGAPVLLVRPDLGANDETTAFFGTVLVPLDGSMAAESILPHAVWLCKATGASLQLIRVLRPDEISQVSPTLQEDATDAAIRSAERALRSVAARQCDGPCPISATIVVRVDESPAVAINEYAAANHIRVVALTTHGSGFARLIGSVADKVIRDGPPLILLLRPAEPTVPAFAGQSLHCR